MRDYSPTVSLLAAMVYWTIVTLQGSTTIKLQDDSPEVVVAAPIQVLMYFGDRFLAGNFEAIRASALTASTETQLYRQRAHLTVSQLHPCHEDNYWIGNAALSWGGAMTQGLDLLGNATQCRFWDEWPPFFYGFNQNFFLFDIEEARRVLEIAAIRSPTNANFFRTYSAMLAAGKIDNIKMAADMLEKERDNAKEPKLKEMLNNRVIRLKGLLLLRDAQQAYEKKFGRDLENPQDLITQKLLDKFPQDPLRIGYEFRENRFQLRQIKVQ